MRKVKFVKVVVPEILAYLGNGNINEIPEYICPECEHGIADDYSVCSYCSSELNWKSAKKPSKEFLKFVEKFYAFRRSNV